MNQTKPHTQTLIPTHKWKQIQKQQHLCRQHTDRDNDKNLNRNGARIIDKYRQQIQTDIQAYRHTDTHTHTNKHTSTHNK